MDSEEDRVVKEGGHLRDPLFEYTTRELDEELATRRKLTRPPRPLWQKIPMSPYLVVRWAWRKMTVQGLIKFALLCTSAFVVLGFYNTVQLGRQTKEQRQTSLVNRQILKSIEEQTSPDAEKARQELIAQILTIADCNNQETLDRLVGILVERGILEPGDLKAITEQCELILAASGKDGD